MPKEYLFKRVLQIFFFLTLFSPLVVDRRLFFPYITSATLFMRAVLGILFLLWLIYVLRYKGVKHLFSGYLTLFFAIYILALAVATFFGQTPYLSFWGDAERAMGLFGMLHFFVLFLIGASIFNPLLSPPSKGGEGRVGDLMLLLNVFVAISSVVALHGIFQHFGLTSIKPGEDRIVATVGNAGVLAGYLIFGLFFSLYLVLKKGVRYHEKRYLTPFYFIALAVHAFAIFLTGTRGAYLGIAAGFLFAFIIFIVKSPLTPPKGGEQKLPPFREGGGGFFKRRFSIRKKLLAAFALIVIVVTLALIAQNAGWIKTTGSLYRLTHFSLADSNIQTRFLSWQAGLKGFLERPVLGWGFENFVSPFNKNFNPAYYNFVPTDEYFDRAHNIVVELLATTGIIGLLSYFLLLSAIVYSLIKVSQFSSSLQIRGGKGWGVENSNNTTSPQPPPQLRRGGESHDIYLSVFGGLLIAYFVQNLFIFDLLPTMLGFVTFLVVVNGFAFAPTEGVRYPEKRYLTPSIRPVFLVVPVVALVIALIYFYSNFVVKPFKALKDNVFGQVFIEANYAQGMEYLKNSVSYNTYLDFDIRSAAANTIYNYYKNRDIQSDNKKSDINFAVDLYKKDLAILPNDNYYNYKIGEILNFRFAVDMDEKIIQEARDHLQKAILLSPGRANSRHILTENYLLAGNFDEAINVAKEAVALNDRYGSSYWELTKAYYTKGDFPNAKENLIKTINFHHHVGEQNMERFAHLFEPAKSSQNQIEYFELIVKNGTTNYMYDSTLAALYYEIGNKEEAIAHARRAAELNPSVKEKVEKFIKKVEASL